MSNLQNCSQQQKEAAENLLNGMTEHEIKIVLSTISNELLVEELLLRLIEGESIKNQLADIVFKRNNGGYV